MILYNLPHSNFGAKITTIIAKFGGGVFWPRELDELGINYVMSTSNLLLEL